MSCAWGGWLSIPARHIFVVMGFFALVNVYTLRVNLSVAIVAMVKHPAEAAVVSNGTGSINYTQCQPENNTRFRTTTNPFVDREGQAARFDWDAQVQGLVLGSFFYGYIVTVLPGGVLAEQLGPKWLIGVGVAVTSLLSMLLPVAAHAHYMVVVAIRVLQGLAEGVVFPAMHCMIAMWTPITSRSRVISIVQSGADVGAVVAMMASGVLAESTFLGGWPSIFYVFGFAGVVWFIAWCFLVYDTPSQHPRISHEELDFIISNQGNEQAQLKRKVPWRRVLLSIPIWSGVLSHFGFNWIHYIFLTEMPTYLTSVLHYSLGANGLLSAVPYILGAIFCCVASLASDVFRKRGTMTITNNRKLFNTLGVLVPGLFLLLVPLASCNGFWNMVLLAVAGGFHGMGHSGFMAAFVDLAPDFAGTLLGISNVAASIPGFAIPAVLGELLKEQSPLEAWALFFYIGSAIGILTGLEFILLGSADIQSWGVDTTFKVVAKYGAAQDIQPAVEETQEQGNIIQPAASQHF
ncbi:sialin-like isoform X2 [Amblyomma americanum]